MSHFETICKIDHPGCIISTPCGKFIIGIQGHSIYKCNLETKCKVIIAGLVNQYGYQDGTRNEARFNHPKGLTLSKDSKILYVMDSSNGVIRTICTTTGKTSTLPLYRSKTNLKYSTQLKISPSGNELYVQNDNSGYIYRIDIETNIITLIYKSYFSLLSFVFSPHGNSIIVVTKGGVFEFNLITSQENKIIYYNSMNYDIMIHHILINESSLIHSNYSKKALHLRELNNNGSFDNIQKIIQLQIRPNYIELSNDKTKIYVCSKRRIIAINTCDLNICNTKDFTKLNLSIYSPLPPQIINNL